VLFAALYILRAGSKGLLLGGCEYNTEPNSRERESTGKRRRASLIWAQGKATGNGRTLTWRALRSWSLG
jgi:hypothetical protein